MSGKAISELSEFPHEVSYPSGMGGGFTWTFGRNEKNKARRFVFAACQSTDYDCTEERNRGKTYPWGCSEKTGWNVCQKYRESMLLSICSGSQRAQRGMYQKGAGADKKLLWKWIWGLEAAVADYVSWWKLWQKWKPENDTNKRTVQQGNEKSADVLWNTACIK